MLFLLKIIENIGSQNTDRKDLDSLKSLNVSLFINFLYSTLLVSFFIVNEINYGTTLLISLLVLFTPLFFLFNNLGYSKIISLLFILFELTIISFLHISIYVVDIYSSPFILFTLCILLQVLLVIINFKERNAFFLFLFFLMLSFGFIIMKFYFQHQIKIFLTEKVFFIEMSTLIFGALLFLYHIYLLAKKHNLLNLFFQSYREKINIRLALLEKTIAHTTSNISKIQSQLISDGEITRLASIHDKLQSVLLYDTTTLFTKAEIYDITCRYIMSVFNAKHIALYELRQEMNDNFHLRCLYLSNIKKHSTQNIFSSLFLQHLQSNKKDKIINDFSSNIIIGGLENKITANQLLFMPIQLDKSKYVLICHIPTIKNLEEFQDFYKKDILFMFETMQLKIASLNTIAMNERITSLTSREQIA